MKKIIGGVIYDTDGAFRICDWSCQEQIHGVDLTFTHTLWRKRVPVGIGGFELHSWGSVGVCEDKDKYDRRKGEFFVTVNVGGLFGEGRLDLVSDEQAKRIFEEHSSDIYKAEEKYEEIFGPVTKDPFCMLKEAFEAGVKAQREREEAEKKVMKQREETKAGASEDQF